MACVPLRHPCTLALSGKSLETTMLLKSSEAANWQFELECIRWSKIQLTSPLLCRLLWHASLPDCTPVAWLPALLVHSGSLKAACDRISELDHALSGNRQHRHQSFEVLQPLCMMKNEQVRASAGSITGIQGLAL